MQDYSESAINAARKAKYVYCKFISPNEAGVTKSHQYGYYISKNAYSMIFGERETRGSNEEQNVTIKWQDNFETSSRFEYYGNKTRNEYRLTRVPREAPFAGDEAVGNLMVLIKVADDYYQGYILQTEDEINAFLEYFNLSPIEANGLIEGAARTPSGTDELMKTYLSNLPDRFPDTFELSSKAQAIFNAAKQVSEKTVIDRPDYVISGWIDTEYRLFQEVEKLKYSEYLGVPLSDVDSFIALANTILNRRKSRAGKSLEHHLAKIFDVNKLPYSAQKVTEEHKKPDFILPSIEFYHDRHYSDSRLIFLGAKTTCKDRWRQILNEADRVKIKHLFTLQPGISSNQLEEMRKQNVILVVPQKNVSSFRPEDQHKLLTLKDFIGKSKSLLAI